MEDGARVSREKLWLSVVSAWRVSGRALEANKEAEDIVAEGGGEERKGGMLAVRIGGAAASVPRVEIAPGSFACDAVLDSRAVSRCER
jgi:hypothetical protein